MLSEVVLVMHVVGLYSYLDIGQQNSVSKLYPNTQLHPNNRLHPNDCTRARILEQNLVYSGGRWQNLVPDIRNRTLKSPLIVLPTYRPVKKKASRRGE